MITQRFARVRALRDHEIVRINRDPAHRLWLEDQLWQEIAQDIAKAGLVPLPETKQTYFKPLGLAGGDPALSHATIAVKVHADASPFRSFVDYIDKTLRT